MGGAIWRSDLVLILPALVGSTFIVYTLEALNVYDQNTTDS